MGWFVLVLFTIIILQDFIALFTFYVVVLTMFKLSRIPLSSLFDALKWIFRVVLPLYVVFGLIFYGYPEGSTLLFYLIPFIKAVPVTIEAINYILAMSMRIIMIASSIALISGTTSVTHMQYAAAKMRIPPALGIAGSISIVGLPIIMDQAAIIEEAQVTRGLNFKQLNIKEKLTKGITVKIIPLLLYVMERSMRLATTLECKGVGYSGKRSYLEEPCFKKTDYVFITLWAICVLIMLYLIYYHGLNNLTIHLTKMFIAARA